MKQIRNWAAIFIAIGLSNGVHAQAPLFPEPDSLAPNIAFWLRVYSEIDSQGGLVHDDREMDVVYEVVQFPEGADGEQRLEISESATKRVVRALRTLSEGKRVALTPTEKSVLRRWPDGVSNETLAEAASRVRFQRGGADRFKRGLSRSGRFRDHVDRTLEEYGIPPDLAALPYVESSYNPSARSRLGALGLWQFTAPTGKRFMRVDHVVDERLDPFLSTIAAARLLELNHGVTGKWPLAITAYNHGAGGVRRGMATVKSDDIAVLVEEYDGPYFGFASRNFYSEFLAARRIHQNPEKYFGKQVAEAPTSYEIIEVDYFLPSKALTGHLGLSEALVRQHNPALLETVWSGAKHIPKGFPIRIPSDTLDQNLADTMAELPDTYRFAKQIPDRHYTVRRGDALSRIAARYGVTQRQLVALNNLRNANHIWIGQKLKLPLAQNPASAAFSYSTARTPRGTYRVKPGDSLSTIASRRGITTGELARINGLSNLDRIQAGQLLRFKALPEDAPAEAMPSTPRDLQKPEDIAADPSDYRVAKDGSIEIQAAETLGHYAAWLDVPTQTLRERNNMAPTASLQLGERITLFPSATSQTEFERKRVAYHRALQEDFFERFEITGTRIHRTQPGDSLWTLAEEKYGVPLWLLRQYNPDLGARGLRVGEPIAVPRVRRHDDSPG